MLQTDWFSLLHRGCTDIICCIIFVVAIVGYVAVGILGESVCSSARGGLLEM